MTTGCVASNPANTKTTTPVTTSNDTPSSPASERIPCVALDATPLSVPTGGIPRYTAALSEALAEEYPDTRFLLLTDQPVSFPRPALPNLRLLAPPQGLWRRFWWSAGLPRALAQAGVTVFHGTDFAVPYLPLRPSVMMVHDLSPWRFPHWQPAAERVRRRTPWLIALRLATLVLTPSQAVRQEVIRHFRLPPSRVVSTPLGVGSAFQPAPTPPSSPRYLLFVGTIEPRKNLPLLIGAWRPLFAQSGVELWLAGRARSDAPPLPALPGLRLLGPVPDAELPALYQGAVAFLYPSHYEGFGLPVLEAMACGAPVLIARCPALAELAGDAAEALDPDDLAGWRAAMRAYCENPSRRAEARERSLRRARAFSWRQTARLTFAAYAEAIRRHE